MARVLLVIAVSGGIVIFCVISFVWALIMLLPYYLVIAAAIYVVWRADQRSAARQIEQEKIAWMNRAENDREYQIWRDFADGNAERAKAKPPST